METKLRQVGLDLQNTDLDLSRLLAKLPAAAYTCDSEGLITYFNERAAELWGREPKLNDPTDRFCGSFGLFSPAGDPICHDECWMALALREEKEFNGHEIAIERPDGTRRVVLAHANPFHDEQGRIAGAVNVLVDITARRRAEVARSQLSAIVESSDDVIISKDLNGYIQSWNAAAQQLFGYTAEEAVGRHISFLIPADRIDEEDRILARLRNGERVYHFDTVRLRSDGQPIHVSLTISPIRDEGGRIIGASKIIRDITDRKLMEERIYRLMTQLKEADRYKDEFLAVIGHELRNPLAPLSNLVEVIKRGDDGVLISADVRATLERQVAQMVRLVDDLLDVNRIARNMLELRREPIKLADVIQGAVEMGRPLNGQHELMVSLPPEPIYLYADRTRLSQVFMNLLNNAAKFSDPGSVITLSAVRDGNDVVVSVKDTGVGIPSEKLPHVFEMFYQVEATREERSPQGLGIGLALVQRLVEMHGGTVTARSEGAGKGSEFIVRLPALGDPLLPIAPARDERRATSTGRRILVVDDSRDAAESLGALLKITGNDVRIAHDGLTAVELAESFRPEVVLLDLGLPKLSGYDVCRRIREQTWGKDMLLLALTGWGQEEDCRASQEAGFDHHLVKPLDFQNLMGMLAGLKPNENLS